MHGWMCRCRQMDEHWRRINRQWINKEWMNSMGGCAYNACWLTVTIGLGLTDCLRPLVASRLKSKNNNNLFHFGLLFYVILTDKKIHTWILIHITFARLPSKLVQISKLYPPASFPCSCRIVKLIDTTMHILQ